MRPGNVLLIISGFVVGLLAAFASLAFQSDGSTTLQLLPVVTFFVVAAALTHSTGAVPTTLLALLLPALPISVAMVRLPEDGGQISPLYVVAAWMVATFLGCTTGLRIRRLKPKWSTSRSGWLVVGLAWFMLVVVAWRLS